jgi:hypothetical protein
MSNKITKRNKVTRSNSLICIFSIFTLPSLPYVYKYKDIKGLVGYVLGYVLGYAEVTKSISSPMEGS